MKRRRGIEILDDPSVDPAIRERSIGDVRRSNALLGGRRAVLRAFLEVLPSIEDGATVLDVGTGLADIPAAVVRSASERGRSIRIVAVDEACSLLHASRTRLDWPVCANALALPFRDEAIDVVIASQVLHHFEDADAERLLREMNRVARRAVIVSDLRRSWIAAIGFWLVSFPLRFHPVTRHDGVVSVLRGFTAADLKRLIRAATGKDVRVRRRPGWRVTASWFASDQGPRTKDLG